MSTFEKAWIWLKTHWYVPVGLLLVLVSWLVSRLVSVPGKWEGEKLLSVNDVMRESELHAQREITAAQARTEAKIQEVEAKHEATLNSLEQRQREEYVEVRQRGPKATAAWLNDKLKGQGL